MTTHEVIQINSDDEIIPSTSVRKAASVDIINSMPLDLTSLQNNNKNNINMGILLDQNRVVQSASRRSNSAPEKSEQNTHPNREANKKTGSLNKRKKRGKYGSRTKSLQSKDAKGKTKGKKKVAGKRSVNTSNYQIEVFQKQGTSCDEEFYPNLTFRCFVPKCGKVLNGNFAFISHIWAHVASHSCFSPAKGLADACLGSSDAKHEGSIDLSLCPHCLRKFETPFLLQKHIVCFHCRHSEVLAVFLCKICENKVGNDPRKLFNHLNLLHSENDVPYNCKICPFRTNVRFKLLHHFMRRHRNSCHLLCPFCSHTFTVPAVKRRNTDTVSRDYKEHMFKHLSNSEQGCNKCACSFQLPALSERHEVRDHHPPNLKWSFRYISDSDCERNLKSVFVADNRKYAFCRKCNSIDNKKKRTFVPRCLKCIAAQFRENEGECFKADNRVSTTHMFQCQCGFVSRNGVSFPLHCKSFNHKYRVVSDPLVLATRTVHDIQNDVEEGETFALVHKRREIVKKKKNDRDSRRHVFTDFKGRVAKVNAGSDLVDQALVLLRNTLKDNQIHAEELYNIMISKDTEQSPEKNNLKSTKEQEQKLSKYVTVEACIQSKKISRKRSRTSSERESSTGSVSNQSSDNYFSASKRSHDIITIDDDEL